MLQATTTANPKQVASKPKQTEYAAENQPWSYGLS
jgi:hypothetical protein